MTLGWLKTKINIDSEAGGLVSTEPTNEEYTYFTDAQPLAPLGVPWIEVLNASCNWADGEAGATACAYDSTFGLYFSHLFAYNLGTWGVPTLWVDRYGRFLLSDFLDEIGHRSGNCVDVSGYLHLSLSAIGVYSPMVRLYANPVPSVFMTNLICPIGSDPDNPPSGYSFVGFTMHQVCRVHGATYDASLGLEHDPGGSPYENPPAGWSPNDHWQAPSGQPQYGVVRRYGHQNDDFGTEENPQQFIDPDLPHEVVPRSEGGPFSLAGVI
ncbi:MAG: hypothetical protein ACR2HJ_08320 [Fimbriimonadales bacterium]